METMVVAAWLEKAVWSLLVLAGWGLALLALPGIWVMWGIAAAYVWRMALPADSWLWLAQVAGVGLVAELIEALGGFWGVRREKGSWGASFLTAGGAIAGAIAGSILLPLFGTVLGAAAGAYAVAYLVLRKKGYQAARSRQIAWTAAWYQLLAYIAKTIAATLIAGWILWRFWQG